MFAAREEEPREEQDEDDLAVDGEEVQNVLEGVVTLDEVVQRVVDAEVPGDATTLAPRLQAPSTTGSGREELTTDQCLPAVIGATGSIQH